MSVGIRAPRVRASWPTPTPSAWPSMSRTPTSSRSPWAAGRPALAEEYGVPVEPTAEALLARDDVAGVIIATPHSTHLPLTLAAAGGRQARLPREADGRHARRLRPDDRGVPRGGRPAHGQPRDPLPPVPDDGEGPPARRQDRRAPDGPRPELGHRLPARRPRLGQEPRGGRRLARHGRPHVRCPPVLHRFRGRRRSLPASATSAAWSTSAGARWPRWSCAAASSPSCWSAWRCRRRVSDPRASGPSIGSDGIIESDSYGKVRLGTGDDLGARLRDAAVRPQRRRLQPGPAGGVRRAGRGVRRARSKRAAHPAWPARTDARPSRSSKPRSDRPPRGQAVRLPLAAG